MPRYVDSIDKIICSYFVALTKEKFIYKDKEYKPLPLYISPTLIRTIKCQLGCGACCSKFSLDYIPTEDRPKKEKKRKIKFNNQEIKIYTDIQEENDTHSCKYLDKKKGYCKIHEVNPFSCDFELLRVLTGKKKNRLQKSIFPRGWNMTQINGKKGVHCKICEDTDGRQETIRKLKRLEEWMNYFGIQKTYIKEVIKCVKSNKLPQTLVPYRTLIIKKPLLK